MSYRLNKYHNNAFGLLDPFFEDFFADTNRTYNELMKTDITDEGEAYQLKIDMPSINKEDIKISLNEGYLNVEASFNKNDENKGNKYLRRERHYGSASRSFYVGDNIKEEDISAKLENGVLILDIKKPVENKVEEKKYIEIK